MRAGKRGKGATQSKVVRPSCDEPGLLGPGVGVLFRVDGEDTGGALSIVEHPFDVGALVPPHVHTLEDEVSIVLEGEMGFRSENREVVLGPGGFIVKPRGEVHAMWNAGATRARMVELISPAGFENFFRELAEMNESGPVVSSRLIALSRRYELAFAQPDWLSDVIGRYGLNRFVRSRSTEA